MKTKISKKIVVTKDGHKITLINLLQPAFQKLYGTDLVSATSILESLDTVKLDSIKGEFALASFAKDKLGRNIIVGARTIGVPARVACQLISSKHTRIIFAHTINEIAEYWLTDQQKYNLKTFDPSYTEMLPAYYIVKIKPWAIRDREYSWFLQAPEHQRPDSNMLLHAQIDIIGKSYVDAVYNEITRALQIIPPNADIGVSLSGGIDSSLVTLLLIDAVKKLNRKNKILLFTLSIGNKGIDKVHAAELLNCLPEKFRQNWYPISAPIKSIHPNKLRLDVSNIIEEYHVRDLEGAMANFILLKEIRKYHPNLKYIFDGDGGNEAFEDYPLEDEGYGRITIDDVWDDPQLF